jgi:hypothetical protein
VAKDQQHAVEHLDANAHLGRSVHFAVNPKTPSVIVEERRDTRVVNTTKDAVSERLFPKLLSHSDFGELRVTLHASK